MARFVMTVALLTVVHVFSTTTALGQAAAPRPADAGDSKAGQPAKPAAAPPSRTLELQTSDGLALVATYYPPIPNVDRIASVLLVHDLEGSHATVEPLAKVLQQVGCDVLTPDLRGHGASLFPAKKPGDKPESRPLRKPDFDMIVASTPNQQVREQATVRGDLEVSLLALLDQSGEDRPPVCVVGCGFGGTLAALWTNSDWGWRPLTTGQQGRHVKGLVLVSPVWAEKGINIKTALDSPPIRETLPVLILSGKDESGKKDDKDAGRAYDYFTRLRPEKAIAVDLSAGQKPDAKDLADKTVFSFVFGTSFRADKLASEGSITPAPAVVIADFVLRKVR